jgi:hypothetical protein
MSDNTPSLAIGALVLDERVSGKCPLVYAGTGENAIRRDTYYGAGLLIYKGSNGEIPQCFWDLEGADIFKLASINNVVLDRTTSGSSQRLYVTLSSGVTASASESTVTAPPPPKGYGIYLSENQGTNWTRLTVPGAEGAAPTDLEMDPNNSNILYAGFLGRGIFRGTRSTVDGSIKWCPLNPGIPLPAGCSAASGLPDPSTNFDHVEISLHRSANPTVLYAIIGNCPDPIGNNSGTAYGDCFPPIYKSVDGQGASWVLVNPSAPYFGANSGSYTRYTHVLTVHPADPSTIIFGGLQLWKSTTSGMSFDEIGVGGLHPDHHAVLFPDPANPNLIYDVNDGGFFYSNDGGATFQDGNTDLQITQFQSISSSPLTFGVIGGTQDNGTEAWVGTRVWEHRDNGDSASTIIDLDVPQILLYDVYFGADPRISPLGGSCCNWLDIKKGLVPNETSAVYPPMVQDPSPPHQLYLGTNVLHKSVKSTNAFSFAWNTLSPVLGGTQYYPDIQSQNVITAIAVAPTDPNRIYVGFYDGQIWVTGNTGPCANPSCWTPVDLGANGLPHAVVTRIAVDSGNRDTAYVTYSAVPRTIISPSSFDIGAHVYKTQNGGSSWMAASGSGGGALPSDLPVNTILIEPSTPSHLWIGTDRGVFKSTDSGANWLPFNSGLPVVPVYDFAIDEPHGRLFAGTHGRGAFVLTQPFLTNFEGWSKNGIWDILVYGGGFTSSLMTPPGSACTMQIFQQNGGAPCASSTTDVLGGTITFDQSGQLVTTNPAYYMGRQVALACYNSNCIGGKTIDQCNPPSNPVTSVTVSCGTQVGFDHITNCPEQANPPSSVLGLPGFGGGGGKPAPRVVNPATGADGIFHVVPTVQVMDGSTRVLCDVPVPFKGSDEPEDILGRARDAINSSLACTSNTVSAAVSGSPSANRPKEDPPGSTATLSLQAPGVRGTQLITSLRAAPGDAKGRCFDVNAIGLPLQQAVTIMKVNFDTRVAGAAGGQITVAERSNLGVCQVTVPTSPGSSAATIAADIAASFQAPGVPGPNACPSRANPRDIVAVGDALRTVMANELVVCLKDDGVGFTLTAEELPLSAINLFQPARVLTFTADPPEITAGDSATLTWSTENAFDVNITNLGLVPPSGSAKVKPTEDTF